MTIAGLKMERAKWCSRCSGSIDRRPQKAPSRLKCTGFNSFMHKSPEKLGEVLEQTCEASVLEKGHQVCCPGGLFYELNTPVNNKPGYISPYCQDQSVVIRFISSKVWTKVS